jgi:hypothetical protein
MGLGKLGFYREELVPSLDKQRRFFGSQIILSIHKRDVKISLQFQDSFSSTNMTI